MGYIILTNMPILQSDIDDKLIGIYSDILLVDDKNDIGRWTA